MNTNWDDPFGEAGITPDQKQRHTFLNAKGLIVARDTVDIDEIKKSQQKLSPYFEALYEAASELLDEADPVSKKLSERPVFTTVIYRIPDAPDLLNSLEHETTAHIVTLVETGERSHPIVERLFPLKSFDSLTESQQNILRSVVQMRLAKRTIDDHDMPQHIRVVFPEVIDYIMTWLNKIDGTINHLNYTPWRPNRNDQGPRQGFHIN